MVPWDALGKRLGRSSFKACISDALHTAPVKVKADNFKALVDGVLREGLNRQQERSRIGVSEECGGVGRGE